jgi:hypothetical protein
MPIFPFPERAKNYASAAAVPMCGYVNVAREAISCRPVWFPNNRLQLRRTAIARSRTFFSVVVGISPFVLPLPRKKKECDRTGRRRVERRWEEEERKTTPARQIRARARGKERRKKLLVGNQCSARKEVTILPFLPVL